MCKDIVENIKTYATGYYGFINCILINDNTVTIQYTYDNNNEKHVDYFETGDKINKILMEDAFRICYHNDFVENIYIIVKNNTTTHSINITKTELEHYIGFKFFGIKNDDDWRIKISNVFFNKNYRKSFIDKYITVLCLKI